MNLAARTRLLTALRRGERYRSARKLVAAAGGATATTLAALREMLEVGEVVEVDGAFALPGAAPAPPPPRRRGKGSPASAHAAAPSPPPPPAEPEPAQAPAPISPGSWSTVQGLAEHLDRELVETTKLLDAKRRIARRGDAAAEIAALTRVCLDLVRRRRELIPDDHSETLLTDAELERRILEAAQEVVADRLGSSPDRVGFAVLADDGGHQVVPLARVVRDG